MFNKVAKRLGDDFYVKEKSKIKFTDRLLLKKIQKFKSKKLKVVDVGFGNADLMNLIKNNFSRWECIGLDSNIKLIKFARKKYPKFDFYKFDLMKSKIEKYYKADLIICVGVVQIFDDLKKCIDKLIKLANKNSKIYIISIFNPYSVDLFTRYKFVGDKTMQLGWNKHSLLSLKNCFLENKRVKKININKIKFPKSLKVKKTTDFMRSWTVNFNKKKHFYNATGIQHQYIVEVTLK